MLEVNLLEFQLSKLNITRELNEIKYKYIERGYSACRAEYAAFNEIIKEYMDVLIKTSQQENSYDSILKENII